MSDATGIRIAATSTTYPVKDAGAVRYAEAQTLTPAQQAQARENIDAMSLDDLPESEPFVGGQTVETQYNGSDILAENTVAAKIQDFTLYGKSVQGSTTGKNLLKTSPEMMKSANPSGSWSGNTCVLNGVTFAIQTDASGLVTTINVNGNPSSGDVVFYLNKGADSPVLPAGQYILTGCPEIGGASWETFALIHGDYGQYNSPKQFEVTETYNSASYIKIGSGYTANNLVFRPMIRLASITDDTYEPYTGGIPAPNPDYPMPIDSTGDTGSIPVSIEWREIPSENAGITQNIVGLEIDYVNKTFTRLADAAGKTAGEDFNHIAPYGGRKRCNVADDGTITAWRGDANYREDGSNGQVMVYQPKFWYKRDIITKDASPTLGYNIRKERIYITDRSTNGYKLHPVFVDPNGDEVDYVMFSAYEACIYDTSASAYLMRDEYVMDVNTDKLSSIANAKPASGLAQQLTRPNVEALAQNRGANWHGDLIKLESANQILAIVELGMMNGQTAIESGVSGITDNSAYNCSSLTGSTSALGDATGAATSTTNEINGTTTEYDTAGKRAISYRGVENPFGNIWKFVYGINIHGNGSQGGGVPYVCTDFAFAESKNSGNYESAGFTLTNASGYISAMGYGNEKFDWLFMPSEVNGNGANSTLPVGDYTYITSNLNGYRIVLMGGGWNAGAYCGFFYWACNNGVGYCYRNFGGRLAYVPVTGAAHDGNVERWMKRSGFWKSAIDIPTPNGLPGVPVDSGGNYTDGDGQMWLCDTIDKATGTYTQRVKRLVLNGTEEWETWDIVQHDGFQTFRPREGSVLIGRDGNYMATDNQIPIIMCSALIPYSINGAVLSTGTTRTCVAASTTSNGLYIVIPQTVASTVAELKAWLAETPMTVLYPLAIPATIDLTTAQIAALDALQSHAGSTTIYTSDPVQPDMDVGILTGVSGDKGIVPAPSSANEYLGSDGAWHQPDIAPTAGSDNLITSAAVQAAIAALMARIEALEGGN